MLLPTSCALSAATGPLLHSPRMQAVVLRARACSEVGSGWWLVPLVKPMGTTIAGAPVGGGICGESLPARARGASGW